MKNRGKNIGLLLTGMAAGAALCGGAYAAGIVAQPTWQPIFVDGQQVEMEAYNINGNNFVKLRDIAYLLNGTEKQFQVGFVSASNSIFISRKTAYTSVGQENLALDSPKRVIPSKQSVYLDSAQVSPMTYNIDGNNYMMLRDLALLVDFGMSYDSASGTVDITTANSYSPNK